MKYLRRLKKNTVARYKLTYAAKEDLKGIWRYSVNAWGRNQAIKYRDEIKLAIKLIAKSPERGRPRDDVRPAYRAFKVGKHLIFYRKTNGWIEIVRILHEQMNFGSHF